MPSATDIQIIPSAPEVTFSRMERTKGHKGHKDSEGRGTHGGEAYDHRTKDLRRIKKLRALAKRCSSLSRLRPLPCAFALNQYFELLLLIIPEQSPIDDERGAGDVRGVVGSKKCCEA